MSFPTAVTKYLREINLQVERFMLTHGFRRISLWLLCPGAFRPVLKCSAVMDLQVWLELMAPGSPLGSGVPAASRAHLGVLAPDFCGLSPGR